MRGSREPRLASISGEADGAKLRPGAKPSRRLHHPPLTSFTFNGKYNLFFIITTTKIIIIYCSLCSGINPIIKAIFIMILKSSKPVYKFKSLYRGFFLIGFIVKFSVKKHVMRNLYKF